jgi:thioredoxin-related protein
MFRYIYYSGIVVFFVLFLGIKTSAQDSVKIYNTYADAKQDLQLAIKQANSENKHVLVQIGGNWCPWCVRLHHFFESNRAIDSILKADYVIVRVNYSKENKNPDIMEMLGFPQRFGFPVLVVLDDKGNRLHTQNTGYLELEKSYDEEKVRQFLLGWNKSALNPSNYK